MLFLSTSIIGVAGTTGKTDGVAIECIDRTVIKGTRGECSSVPPIVVVLIGIPLVIFLVVTTTVFVLLVAVLVTSYLLDSEGLLIIVRNSEATDEQGQEDNHSDPS